MLHLLFQNGLQTSWWWQSVTCFYHYSIGEYSTVHFIVTMHSKFWRTASKIWLFVDNFGAWKCTFGSLKVLEKSLNFVLWVCYEPCFMLILFSFFFSVPRVRSTNLKSAFFRTTLTIHRIPFADKVPLNFVADSRGNPVRLTTFFVIVIWNRVGKIDDAE